MSHLGRGWSLRKRDITPISPGKIARQKTKNQKQARSHKRSVKLEQIDDVGGYAYLISMPKAWTTMPFV
jgi:hypothetical protein